MEIAKEKPIEYEQPKWVEIIIQLCKECKKSPINLKNGEQTQNA